MKMEDLPTKTRNKALSWGGGKQGILNNIIKIKRHEDGTDVKWFYS